jgi:TolB protein
MSAMPMFARRGRGLSQGQRADLVVIDRDGQNRTVIFTADEVIEAPNWTLDGRWLVFNAGGELWRIAPEPGSLPEKIDTGLFDLNNDHVLDPDGVHVFVSSDDGHIYRVPLAGGAAIRISNTHPQRHHYYLHGISPDGLTLVYTGVNRHDGNDWGRVNIWTIPATGGPDVALTDALVPSDGAEYTPDGAWIWFNSELGSPGQAQIFRMRPDGSDVGQITFDDRVNWFPHFSPDGEWLVYLSYPPGTVGHPPDREVMLCVMRPNGSHLRDIATFNGGQGTINVNSWSPDSARLAYVAYPLA